MTLGFLVSIILLSLSCFEHVVKHMHEPCSIIKYKNLYNISGGYVPTSDTVLKYNSYLLEC